MCTHVTHCLGDVDLLRDPAWLGEPGVRCAQFPGLAPSSPATMPPPPAKGTGPLCISPQWKEGNTLVHPKPGKADALADLLKSHPPHVRHIHLSSSQHPVMRS